MIPLRADGWLRDLRSALPEPGVLADLGLGLCLLALAVLVVRIVRRLSAVREGLRDLGERLEAQEALVAELDRVAWEADPEARGRRDRHLADLLGSLLSYTDSVGGREHEAEPLTPPARKEA